MLDKPGDRWLAHRMTESTHPHEPHSKGIGDTLNWLRAGVLGANDGIVSTAGILIGVAAATVDRGAIFTAGIAARPPVPYRWPWASTSRSARNATPNAP